MKIDSICVCVCVCLCEAIIEVFGSSKARGKVHFTQRWVGAELRVKGHHLDCFSYLETSPLALIEVVQCGLKPCHP